MCGTLLRWGQLFTRRGPSSPYPWTFGNRCVPALAPHDLESISRAWLCWHYFAIPETCAATLGRGFGGWLYRRHFLNLRLDMWAATWSSYPVCTTSIRGLTPFGSSLLRIWTDAGTFRSSRLFTDGTLHHSHTVGQLVGRRWCGYRTLMGPLTYAFGKALSSATFGSGHVRQS